jgi:protein-disulfide isomerase
VAKTPPPTRRNPLAPFYGVLALIAVAGIGILLYKTTHRGGTAATQPIDVAVTSSELARTPGISRGREDAPVVIYEFADFECPHCADFAALVEPLIRERMIDTGLVRYVFYDFPLGGYFKFSFLAARAGRCANEQGKFWPFHDLVFARQSTWATMSDPTDFFVDLAKQAGADADAFEGCLRSDKYAREVTLSRKLGDSLGVTGTPTLFVNGERLANIPNYSELEAVVKQKAGQAPPAPAAADSAAPAPDSGAAQ